MRRAYDRLILALESLGKLLGGAFLLTRSLLLHEVRISKLQMSAVAIDQIEALQPLPLLLAVIPSHLVH